MKFKNLFKFLLVILFAVITSNSWAAKNTIKWSDKRKEWLKKYLLFAYLLYLSTNLLQRKT